VIPFLVSSSCLLSWSAVWTQGPTTHKDLPTNNKYKHNHKMNFTLARSLELESIFVDPRSRSINEEAYGRSAIKLEAFVLEQTLVSFKNCCLRWFLNVHLFLLRWPNEGQWTTSYQVRLVNEDQNLGLKDSLWWSGKGNLGMRFCNGLNLSCPQALKGIFYNFSSGPRHFCRIWEKSMKSSGSDMKVTHFMKILRDFGLCLSHRASSPTSPPVRLPSDVPTMPPL
jgi:hypothetical protein